MRPSSTQDAQEQPLAAKYLSAWTISRWRPLGKTCDEILQRLEKRNIKFSKAKIVMGRSVEYCGYVVSDKGVSPNQGRITALKHLSPPTSVKEVRSLLGALQQLNHFLPDLAEVTKPISNLLKKGYEFIWGRSRKRCG